MAAVADYEHADPSEGIYGLCNPFFVRITRTGSAVFNLKYRIKVTTLQDGNSYEMDVVPTDNVAYVNPIEDLKDNYFKTQYIGADGTAVLDESEGVADLSYSNVRIEIGEVSGASASVPPTFGGYDTSDDFYFYGGYEDPNIPQDANYRNPQWLTGYDVNTPSTYIKLPLVKKDVKIRTDLADAGYPQRLMVAIPNFIKYDDQDLNIENIVVTYFDNDGVLQGSTSADISARHSGLGYWYINVSAFVSSLGEPSKDYAEVYFEYEDAETGVYKTETLTVRIEECNPKNESFRLGWINRFMGMEYQNFQLLPSRQTVVRGGKEIMSDGINVGASTFAASYNKSEPKRRVYGREADTVYTITTDWLSELQAEALTDAYTSPKVLMFDEENNIYPLMVMDKTYKVVENSNELVKVSMRVKLANPNPVIVQ